MGAIIECVMSGGYHRVRYEWGPIRECVMSGTYQRVCYEWGLS